MLCLQTISPQASLWLLLWLLLLGRRRLLLLLLLLLDHHLSCSLLHRHKAFTCLLRSDATRCYQMLKLKHLLVQVGGQVGGRALCWRAWTAASCGLARTGSLLA